MLERLLLDPARLRLISDVSTSKCHVDAGVYADIYFWQNRLP